MSATGTTIDSKEMHAAMAATARAAGEAAARAGLAASTHAVVTALADAATNAAKPGGQSSEFKVGVGAIVLTGATAAVSVLLHALPFAALLGPLALPAVALGTGLLAGLYALSRGNVKAAALEAAQTALVTLVTPPPAPPPR